jgi:hypothetical protein
MATALVDQGATLLDRVAPGWYDELDLGRLRLRDGNSCLLGQTARHIFEALDTSVVSFYSLDDWTEPWRPHYSEACDLLLDRVDNFDPAECGFDFPWQLISDPHSNRAEPQQMIWEMLTCAWMTAATDRRVAADIDDLPYLDDEIERSPATLRMIPSMVPRDRRHLVLA